MTYLRVRVAIGRFSLDLDPTDRPFRPLTLTDSLLGYLLLAFLLAVSVHLLLIQVAPGLGVGTVLLGADAAVLAVAVLLEQTTLVVAGRHFQQKPRTPGGTPDSPWHDTSIPSSPRHQAVPPE